MQDLAKEFLNTYYNVMMNDRQNLINFYLDQSTLNYEGTTYRGLKEINDKFESFSFKTINFHMENFDVKESTVQGGLVITLNGQLQFDGTDTFSFSQSFHLLPNGSNYYVHEELFEFVF